MTEQNEPIESEVEDTGKKSKIIRIALVAIGVLLIAGLSGGVTWFLTKSTGPSDEEIAAAVENMAIEEQAAGGSTTEGGQALYFAIEPEFVVNYQGGGRQRFLLTEITVLARDQITIDTLSQHLPLIRNNLIQLLSRQSYDVLRTDAGREMLAQDMASDIQATLVELIGRPGIERVLFRSFVIQ